MRAAIYARCTSVNQLDPSIDAQIASCRRLAARRGFVVLDDHVYADPAPFGASHDRPVLGAMVAAAQQQQFDVLLVDDPYRLSGRNLFLFLVLADLYQAGAHLVLAADGLDLVDDGSSLPAQVRDLFNRLALSDLGRH